MNRWTGDSGRFMPFLSDPAAPPAHPTGPDGACLLWGRVRPDALGLTCQGMAEPGKALCADCERIYHPPCHGCGRPLRNDAGIERGYCGRCWRKLGREALRDIMTAVRARAVLVEDLEEAGA